MATQEINSVSIAISGAVRSPYWKEYVIAYAILRLALGVNEFMHGFTRIVVGSLSAYVDTTLQQFANTPLPVWQVRSFATLVPFVELIFGALLMVGLWTRWSLTVLALLMVGITFGTSMRGEWQIVFLQLMYSLTYFVMMVTREWDGISVDALLRRRS